MKARATARISLEFSRHGRAKSAKRVFALDVAAIHAFFVRRLGMSGTGSSVPPVNDGLTFQRSAGAFFRFCSAGFGAGPDLLDTGEEQVPAMFLVERHRIIIA